MPVSRGLFVDRFQKIKMLDNPARREGEMLLHEISDVVFGPSIPCSPTGDTTVGSTCAIDTTVNALIPGAVTAGRRSNWEFGQIEVQDGGQPHYHLLLSAE
jgi:hypothetical protein